MTLRCAEPSRNGAEGTRSQWGTAGSAEEPSPEAARLAKALRELSQTGREPNGSHACERGRPPKPRLGALLMGSAAGRWGRAGKAKNEMEKRPLPSVPASEQGTAERMGSWECERKAVLERVGPEGGRGKGSLENAP